MKIKCFTILFMALFIISSCSNENTTTINKSMTSEPNKKEANLVRGNNETNEVDDAANIITFDVSSRANDESDKEPQIEISNISKIMPEEKPSQIEVEITNPSIISVENNNSNNPDNTQSNNIEINTQNSNTQNSNNDEKNTESNNTEDSNSTEENETVITENIAEIEIIGSDYTILEKSPIKLEENDTVFSLLKRITDEKKIQLDYKGKNKSIYIKGIDNLYEFDLGPQSGWIYTVNDEYINVSSGAYSVKQGDVIIWTYTK